MSSVSLVPDRRKPTAVVVDDEPLARQKLRDLVADVPLVEIVGEAATVEEAIRSIETLRPDLVFLDIEMPQGSGLELLERLRHRPLVIFTTAHDRYAVSAFELAALDYLLKPFGTERFRLALSRALEALGGENGASIERARAALDPGTPLRHLFLRDRGRVVPVALEDVERIEARDDYLEIHAGGRSYLLGLTLGELERRIEGLAFVRVHRSHLVHAKHVAAIERHDDHRSRIVMRDGARIVASRAGTRRIRAWSGQGSPIETPVRKPVT